MYPPIPNVDSEPRERTSAPADLPEDPRTPAQRAEHPDRQVRQPERVVVRELGGESVLLDLASERYFGLDEIGTLIWNELLAAPSVEAACRSLERELDVTPAVLRRDVDDLVDRLLEAGLLEPDTEASRRSPS